MLCYRDITWCDFKDCIYFNKCHRALTEQMIKNSIEYGLPICKFTDKPGCYEDKNEN